MPDGASKKIASVRSTLSSASSSEHLLRLVCAILGEQLSCDRVYAAINDSSGPTEAIWGENPLERSLFALRNGNIVCDDFLFSEAFFVNDIDRSRIHSEVLHRLEQVETRSFALIPVKKDKECIGWIEVHFRSTYHKWRKEDAFLLDVCAEYLLIALERLQGGTSGVSQVSSASRSQEDDVYRERLLEARQQYRKVLEYGNLIIVRTNAAGVVTDVIGDTETIFGVSAGELMSDLGVWARFVPARDLRSLVRSLRSVQHNRAEVSEEIRVINHRTGETRWLLIRGVPAFSPTDEFAGWEGFAVDITERHAIQDELVSQRKRLEALYEISRSLHVTMDPSVVTLKGLRALIKATASDCGLSVLFDEQGKLELVATEGFSASDIATLQDSIVDDELLHRILASKQGEVIPDLQFDSQKTILTQFPFLRSAILVPLLGDDKPRGIVALFCQKESRYDSRDHDLALIAGTQICNVLNQAEYYANERRQSDALAFLYRVSHVLGQYQTPREIAEHSFPIIQEEIACKRMWLGVLNEQGTHIVGQAGIGPGMRRHIVRIQIELDMRHDFIDEALKKRQPVVMKRTDEPDCSGLNRIIQKLKPNTLIIVPLVALGQAVGLLILEPVISSPQFAYRKLPLLSSVANELGSVILARRFEAKIADAEKMRMASLFASGVAHNFNNMLQAIMGQASLVEIQVPENSPLAKSARLITEAAAKGASLISQLMSFSSSVTIDRKNVLLGRALRDSVGLYKSIVGVESELELDIEDDSVEVYSDTGHIQRVITNLLVNAKEAFGTRTDGKVKISTRKVRLRSGEIDPELAPGQYLRIDVSDNGPGMDAERVARCFEPFFTTKHMDTGTGVGFTGSGLGLASAYSIVKQHEGLITVRSAPGRGAVFSVYLPLSKQRVNHEETAQSSGKTAAVSKSTDVVLYGVDGIIAGSLRSSLVEFQITAAMLTDRTRTIALAGEMQGRGGLIVVDAEKEDTKLIDFIRSVRSQNPSMKLIVSCIDGKRWTNVIESIGPLDDLEIVEKTLGVWALLSTIKRMLGVKRQMNNLLQIETLSGSEHNGENDNVADEGDDSDFGAKIPE